jgi:hypothetical protein
MGFSRVHPYCWPCNFRRECCEALLSVVIMGHVNVLIYMVKMEAENIMAAEV